MPVHAHVTSFQSQARALALGARSAVEVLGQLLSHHRCVRLFVPPLQARDNALEWMFTVALRAALASVDELHFLPSGPVQQNVLNALWQIFERSVDVEFV